MSTSKITVNMNAVAAGYHQNAAAAQRFGKVVAGDTGKYGRESNGVAPLEVQLDHVLHGNCRYFFSGKRWLMCDLPIGHDKRHVANIMSADDPHTIASSQTWESAGRTPIRPSYGLMVTMAGRAATEAMKQELLAWSQARRELNCEPIKPDEACGECEACSIYGDETMRRDFMLRHVQ